MFKKEEKSIEDAPISFELDKPKETFNQGVPYDLLFLLERVTGEDCLEKDKRTIGKDMWYLKAPGDLDQKA